MQVVINVICIYIHEFSSNLLLGTDGKCQRKSCQHAPSTYNMDDESRNCQSGCPTNTNECLNQTCSQLVAQSFQNVNGIPLVQTLKNARKFNTQIICQNKSAFNYSLSDGITAYYYSKFSWMYDTCQNLPDLTGNNIILDSVCQQVMSNCVGSSYGCVDRQSDCSLFKGNKRRYVQCSVYLLFQQQYITIFILLSNKIKYFGWY
ncbi:unnamed protein product [Paramecium pentaurelia]|uniref:Uncharacterized protein n=1 Tax=Paramecium pentaurelia TaxID=43138 RepID=A0A8S1TNC2_9CILI|nr:unnamed protein product [Paramecium pentaurelia]